MITVFLCTRISEMTFTKSYSFIFLHGQQKSFISQPLNVIIINIFLMFHIIVFIWEHWLVNTFPDIKCSNLKT